VRPTLLAAPACLCALGAVCFARVQKQLLLVWQQLVLVQGAAKGAMRAAQDVLLRRGCMPAHIWGRKGRLVSTPCYVGRIQQQQQQGAGGEQGT
jgi:hypothetical protein